MTPPRVLTPDDSFWLRNRGCADLLIYGILVVALVLVLVARCR